MIRVLLVDDHELFRSALRLRLEQEDGIMPVGEAGTAEQAVMKARALHPDVVLLDLVLPDRSGYDAIANLLKVCPTTRVLVVSSQTQPTSVRQAITAGARGYVPKRASDTELIEAIRRVAAGERYVDPSLGAQLVVPDDVPALGRLSDRERDVLHLLALFDKPRLRRVSNPVEQHPVFWEYCLNSVMADIVADVVGPDVKFHHSKLNFKWANGGEEVKWHYDISFYPHTNYSPLTVGTYLYDCGMEQGPLACLPGSHNIEPMLSQYDAKGNWVGCLSEADVAKLDLSKMRYLNLPSVLLPLFPGLFDQLALDPAERER